MVPDPEVRRVISLEELRSKDYYADLADLAVIFQHEVVEDDRGTWRWRKNCLVDQLYRDGAVYMPSIAECDRLGIFPATRPHTQYFRASLDLNQLRMDLHAGKFSIEEYVKFHMQMGYSLGGFGEVFGQSEASEWGLPGALTWPEDEEHEYCRETVIDYLRRVHAGKVLNF